MRHLAADLAQTQHANPRLASGGGSHWLPLTVLLLALVLVHAALHMQHTVQHVFQHLLRHAGIRQPDHRQRRIQIIPPQNAVHASPQHKYRLQLRHAGKKTGWRIPHHGILHLRGLHRLRPAADGLLWQRLLQQLPIVLAVLRAI
ncbi:hypothetical protein [Aquitalea magnusonii]|uniref:hypothetical protein n=1 Tax=Aquitalea magnusonii TaxID=332411 RepID=UPI001EFBD35F|nr:hypothetical protein [Aquitalea magnusonii]